MIGCATAAKLAQPVSLECDKLARNDGHAQTPPCARRCSGMNFANWHVGRLRSRQEMKTKPRPTKDCQGVRTMKPQISMYIFNDGQRK